MAHDQSFRYIKLMLRDFWRNTQMFQNSKGNTMNKTTLIVATASAVVASILTSAIQNHPANAQSGYGYTAGGSVTMAAATPNASGTSHAWAIDQRTNSVVFCRGEANGHTLCTQSLLPGAAINPR